MDNNLKRNIDEIEAHNKNIIKLCDRAMFFAALSVFFTTVSLVCNIAAYYQRQEKVEKAKTMQAEMVSSGTPSLIQGIKEP